LTPQNQVEVQDLEVSEDLMKRLDLKKEYRELYLPPSRKITVVKVPRLQFLMIEGRFPTRGDA